MRYARARRAGGVAIVAVVVTGALVVTTRHNPHREPPVDDGVPSGTIAFFGTGTACPNGWADATQVAGRAIVGATEPSAVGVTVGSPLGDREDRTHTHAFTGTLTLAPQGIAGANGGNNSGAAAGAYPIAGTSEPATSGLPFVQLRACVKQ